jgi:hypothetical protein
MTNDVRSSADQTKGCGCSNGKAAAAEGAQASQPAQSAAVPQPAPPARAAESKGCCCGG